ncbi:MAG TPA: ribose-phosphate pyrophosphokinase [Candidatus Saccharimonadales bacterium]|nr:ribose-phosphate pyrophosphokinase [Candidatus Saccharimonadales bacterium]
MAKEAGGQLKLISGRSHPKLAAQVAKRLGIKLCGVELADFANGEIICRINESVRGDDVFVLQTHSPNVNASIIEQALILDAAKRASARSVTAICPYLGYARQDRKSRSREPISARLIVDFLSRAGADRVIGIDLHTGQIQGFFDGPFDHLVAMPIFVDRLKRLKMKDLVIVSPDAGRVKLAERYSGLLDCDMAIIHKNRQSGNPRGPEMKYLIGNVKGKNCVIVDDMIDTAGTVCAAANLLSAKGAGKVYGVASHGIFSGDALSKVKSSAFEKVLVSDSLPQPHASGDSKIEVLSVAPLIADAVSAIFNNRSVSALFGGHNHF